MQEKTKPAEVDREKNEEVTNMVRQSWISWKGR